MQEPNEHLCGKAMPARNSQKISIEIKWHAYFIGFVGISNAIPFTFVQMTSPYARLLLLHYLCILVKAKCIAYYNIG